MLGAEEVFTALCVCPTSLELMLGTAGGGRGVGGGRGGTGGLGMERDGAGVFTDSPVGTAGSFVQGQTGAEVVRM